MKQSKRLNTEQMKEIILVYVFDTRDHRGNFFKNEVKLTLRWRAVTPSSSQGCELDLFAELEKNLSWEIENILGRKLEFELEDILRKLEFIFNGICSR